ncbi:ATP-binding protein involved in chromosome partitioning [Okibacterium sp. HSC-33S16]|uniref:P-loop NTPase n=1 Tax=Okibacterium sp. HSC-33S16 TaxID=2910965 RepID=UPI00209CBEB3|nr:P-loop NTPase [Okibacterium sp. HSC-33S16]MCP2030412.1 ATP-binding protein involved in chromosome partitioning [Okibacterium sp. HSC-33S16]
MLPADLVSRVSTALSSVIDPEIRRPITELGMVGDVSVTEDGTASVAIKLTIVGCPAATAIERNVTAAVAGVPGVTRADISVGVMTADERRALTESLRGSRGARHMPFGPDSLTRVYAITSGKGGVGKSTLTANLAAELASRGLSVGIVDADVHGFSIPGLLGLTDATAQPGTITTPTQVGDMILPPIGYGVKVISIGMFLGQAAGHDTKPQAVAWRGPMLHRTLNQFLTDVYFGDLDVLLLDLPPGTGDVAISLGQLLPNAEVLVVTTPQPAAADVAERSGIVARQTGQKVIGVIENMAGLAQPDGSVLSLFGEGGGAEVARRLSADSDAVPLIASVPLSVPLRAGGDAGAPVVLEHPDDPASVAIRSVADALLSRGRGLVGRSLGLAPV